MFLLSRRNPLKMSSESSQRVHPQIFLEEKSASPQSGLTPYHVFPDSVLMAVARQLPTTLAALKKVEGVGTIKLKKYGSRFVGAVAAYVNKNRINVQKNTDVKTKRKPERIQVFFF